MKNSQIARDIISTLEKEHINLYHDVSKEEIEKRLAEIKNIDRLSDLEFDYEMSKLFALFKDAHTSYFLPKIRSNKYFKFFKDKAYIFENGNWEEIKSFGGQSPDVVFQKVREIVNFETEEWFLCKLSETIPNLYVWQMLGIENYVETVSGQKIVIEPLKEVPKRAENHPYEFKILSGNVLYVRYSSCVEDPTYPFEKFVEDIAKQVNKLQIKKYILDVRNNTGGNSEILNPFQELVKKKKLQGVLLINNKVFSSGRFAVARFKKEFNTPLIGEPTGGAAKSYGYMKPLEVDGKKFSASIRLWDFSNIFGYTGAIQPDIFVETTMEDFVTGHDRPLAAALTYLKTLDKNIEM